MTVPRLCLGGTVVCIASGPSLTLEDVNYVRGKATVIAINDAVQWAPWADVLYSSDWKWWHRHRHMRDFTGLRVTVEEGRSQPKGSAVSVRHGVLVLRNTGKEGIERSPDGLRTTVNSGGAAINLAVHLGALRILLLGYDMGPSNGRHHFFDGPTEQPRNYSAYANFRKLIGSMADPLAKAGITVVNCSRETTLTCFTRMRLEDALSTPMAVAS